MGVPLQGCGREYKIYSIICIVCIICIVSCHSSLSECTLLVSQPLCLVIDFRILVATTLVVAVVGGGG